MTWGRRAGPAVLGALIVVLGTAGAAQAGHAPRQTDHCTYETGVLGDIVGYHTWDDVGVTADGEFNVNSCAWKFPDSDPGASGEEPPLIDLIPISNRPIEGEYTAFQVSIIDDVFGNNVGASIATDADHDGLNGEEEEGEISTSFCGTSPVFESDRDYDGDGHDDFGFRVIVFVNGPLGQAFNCDPSQAPTSTSGGILNPAGGMYITVSG